MQNQQWNNLQGNSPQMSAPVPSVYMSEPYALAEQAMLPEGPQYQEENWLAQERPKRGHPVLKTIGLVASLVALFAISAMAGMMSDGKRPYLALFKNNFPEQHTEVKGASTDTQALAQQYSGLSVGNASEVGQADPTNDNYATLPQSGAFYQYVDVLKGNQIVVARQPLPDDFGGNPAALQKLATNVGANQTFSTAKWGAAYMLSTPEGQVVAVANSKTLVFLRSTQQYTKEDWKGYIDTFQLR